MICDFCKKEFNSRRTFSLHLSITEKDHFQNNLDKERFLIDTLFGVELVNRTVESYNKAEVCCDQLYHYGPDIIKYLKLAGLKRSNSEEKKTQRYTEKYINTIINKYGVTNISYLDTVKKKKNEAFIKRYGSLKNYHRQRLIALNKGFKQYSKNPIRVAATVTKSKKTYIKKYGVINPSQIPASRLKISKAHKKLCTPLSYQQRLERTSNARKAVNHRGGFESKIEKRVQQLLDCLKIPFQKHIHKWNYNYDLFIKPNIIIEIQGDMWHALPSKYKSTDLIFGKILVKDIWAKDQRKQLKAKKEGYQIIEIWEHEIRSRNDQELSHLILSRLEEVKSCN
jgi:G:T-mismatch repair DNA endonuclease (very short patch repair protein)